MWNVSIRSGRDSREKSNNPHYKGSTERKKWSQNGSRVEPFSCPKDSPHLGTVIVPRCKVVPFSTKKKVDYGSNS